MKLDYNNDFMSVIQHYYFIYWITMTNLEKYYHLFIILFLYQRKNVTFTMQHKNNTKWMKNQMKHHYRPLCHHVDYFCFIYYHYCDNLYIVICDIHIQKYLLTYGLLNVFLLLKQIITQSLFPYSYLPMSSVNFIPRL